MQSSTNSSSSSRVGIAVCSGCLSQLQPQLIYKLQVTLNLWHWKAPPAAEGFAHPAPLDILLTALAEATLSPACS